MRQGPLKSTPQTPAAFGSRSFTPATPGAGASASSFSQPSSSASALDNKASGNSSAARVIECVLYGCINKKQYDLLEQRLQGLCGYAHQGMQIPYNEWQMCFCATVHVTKGLAAETGGKCLSPHNYNNF